MNALEALLRAYNQEGRHGRKRVRLVALSGASNVLGVCNDLAEIGRIVHQYGARLLVDAAQLVAHRKVDMEACGIDYLAFSAHKAYAPFGTGALVVRKGLLQFSSAELERIRSSGEENIGGIAALGKALVLLQRIGLDMIQQEEQALTGHALRGLMQIPGLTVFGMTPDSPRFSHKGGVIVFSLGNRMAGRVARELAEQGGIGVRSGCHCAHLLIKHLLDIPPLLQQFQGVMLTLFPRLALPGLTRVSLGIENTVGEIDTLIDVLDKIARQPKAEDNPFASKKTDIQRRMDDFARAAAERVYPREASAQRPDEPGDRDTNAVGSDRTMVTFRFFKVLMQARLWTSGQLLRTSAVAHLPTAATTTTACRRSRKRDRCGRSATPRPARSGWH